MADLDIQHLPPVLTAEEAAQLLRVAESQIYRLCRQGKLKHARLGRWVRIPRQVVLDLLQCSPSMESLSNGPVE